MAVIGSGDVVLLYGLDSSGIPVPLKLNSDGSLSGGSSGGSGTVTSVGLSVPGVLFSVAGSPVTTSGTLAMSLLTQVAHRVLIGPASGADATPTFRALVEADLGTGTGTTGKFLRGDMTWSNTLVGPLLFSADNAQDIGASGATRPRTIYVGTSAVLPAGAVATPSIKFGSDTNTGIYQQGANMVSIVAVGAELFRVSTGSIIYLFAGQTRLNTASLLSWVDDLWLGRLAAANLRLGAVPSASPVAQTLTIGEASRPGTDTNIAGANGTIQSGLGTGTGTPSALIFNAPVTVASGSGVQTQTEGFRVQGSGTAIAISFYGHAIQTQQVFATGASHTVDELITVLQNLGLIKQS